MTVLNCPVVQVHFTSCTDCPEVFRECLSIPYRGAKAKSGIASLSPTDRICSISNLNRERSDKVSKHLNPPAIMVRQPKYEHGFRREADTPHRHQQQPRQARSKRRSGPKAKVSPLHASSAPSSSPSSSSSILLTLPNNSKNIANTTSLP